MKKKILSILLSLCITLSLLPSVALAAGNTITPTANTWGALIAAFDSAQNGDTVQLTGDITTGTEHLQYIGLNKAVTLYFNGHTINYNAIGSSLVDQSGLFVLESGGILTLKGSGGAMLTGNYSAFVHLKADGKLIIESGVYTNNGEIGGTLISSFGGAVEIKGGTLSSKCPQTLALVGGTGSISGGSISCDEFALTSFGAAVTVSGGTISTKSNTTAYIASGGSVQMSGGTINNTGSSAALYLNADAGASAVSGGVITSVGGTALSSKSVLSIGSDAQINSTSGIGIRTEGTLTVTGGSIGSESETALYNVGDLSITGGSIHSDSGAGFANMAPSGKSAVVSGGSITSGSYCPAVNWKEGTLDINGGSITTIDGSCAVYNNGAGTVNITGGSLSAKIITVVNNGAGTVKLSAGTIAGIVNYNASGRVVIDGGSVKTIQGTTPINSAGTELSFFGITLTDGNDKVVANMDVTAHDLTFAPAVSYGFNGVKTDASCTVYLWLPSATTNATYKGDISGGLAAGKISLLPNFTARVTVKLNGQTWNTPQQVLLSTSSVSASDTIASDGGTAQNGGVYVFSGLDPDKPYYIWGAGNYALGCSGKSVTRDTPETTVNYYTIEVNAGEGIDYVFIDRSQIETTTASIQANIAYGYIFDRWANTEGGVTVLTTASGGIIMDGKKNLTAYARLNTYTGSVTLNKDGAAWSAFDKTVTLSPSDTAADAAGYRTPSTDAGGKYSFADLSPLVTYHVWIDGEYAGQTVTSAGKDAAFDYYTVTLTKGVNIAAVSENATVLKGRSATIEATMDTDRIFSRWQNTTGALVSSANPYTFTVNGTVSLTSIGVATKYTATVTLKKDDVDWTSSPRNIVLSASDTMLTGTVTGTVTGNTFTFANLPATSSYFVWDADTVTYTGAEIDVVTKTAALDYYSVTVMPDSNIDAITGAGVYLKGSNVTITATPKNYYLITGEDWTDGKYTISNISSAQTITPSVVLNTYTGTITVKKDDAVWTDSGKVITLSTSSTNPETGKLSEFTSLDPRATYYVWDGNNNTGLVLSRASSDVTVNYYSVSVTKNNTSVSGEGVYLAGSSVTLTAEPVGGYDFMGWYSVSTLLSTDTSYSVNNISSKQDLIADSSNTFSAAVSLSGASVSDIKLSTSAESLTGEILGTGSGPYTFTGLIRGTTYYVFDGSTYTGKTVTKETPTSSLRYYTVNLDFIAGKGISSVYGNGAYLEGSTANISATVDTDYAFNGWSGTVSFKDQTSTISNISKDYTLTAEAYKPYTGAAIDISNGSITISNSATAGLIKVVQGSVTYDNISPSQAITITGTSTTDEDYRVTVTAANGATLILHNLSISVNDYDNGYKAMDISTSGDVTLILSGTNTLYANGTWAVALRKEGVGRLTIQSIDGTMDHYLTATGSGEGSAGIGNSPSSNVSNIIINSGTVIANGWGAGIGAFRGNITDITINGGIITANYIGSAENYGGTLTNVTINGGDIDVGKLGATNTSNIIFTGGSLIATSIGTTPTNGSSVVVNKVTLSTGRQNTDVSQSLIIKKQDGSLYSLYSTNDMWTTNDANGYVYLWLPDGTYTATLGTYSKTFTVNGAAISVSLEPTLSLNVPEGSTTQGVTASVSMFPNANINAGDTITVTVTLSGTAPKPGTYTLGLAGTGIGTVASQTLNVAKDDPVNTSKSFSFTMPSSDISNLAVTLSFAETSKHTVSFVDGMTLLGSAAYYEGETYTLMNGGGLQKTGYIFSGWGVTGTQTMSTADVTHTAVWTPNTYKVVFYNDSTTTEQSFTYNAAAAALDGSFTKPGYSLSGWATTPNGPKAFNVGASVQNLTSVSNGTVYLYAVWQAQTYTVSFANGGGTGTMASQSFVHDVAQELTPNTLTREGYTFAGWNDGATTYVNGESISATANMTLTARWTPISYSVKYDANGGTDSMGDQSFTYDTAQDLTINTLSRIGYTFRGWNTKTAGTGTPYDDGASVNNLTTVNDETITFYAQWTPISYSVEYNANGGTGNMADQQYSYNAAQTLTPNVFSRIGYSFAGWNTAANGSGTSYAGGVSVMNLSAVKDEIVTLYAMWTADVYTLSFTANGGTGSMPNQSFATGDTAALRANAFTKAGYSFTGWKDDMNASVAANATVNTIGRSTVLTAQWTANSYTVKFNANGGTGSIGNQSFTYGAAQNLTANAFSRTGYSFAGWSDTPTSSTASYTNSQSVSNLTAIKDDSVTLYAVWTANTYTVTFANGGGTGTMDNQTFTHDVASALNTNAFSKTGYTFAGWKDGATTYVNGESIRATANITLTAQWTANSYTVKYDANGGTGSMGDQSFTYDTAQNLTTNTFSRTGYTFAGWNTAANGTGTSRADGTSVSNLTAIKDGIVTLYAVWTANTYTVTFANGGGTGTMENQSFTHDVASALNTNAFSKTGYIFAGWKEGTTTYVNGESISATANMTLTAQWTPISYSVKFDANGGTGNLANQAFIYNVAQNLTTNTYTCTGYTYEGWNTKADGTGTSFDDGASIYNLSAMNGETITFYAQWTANSYTVKFNANGGTGSMGDQSFTYGTAQNLTTNTFTRTGYSFAGCSETSTSLTASYMDGQSVSNLTSVQNDIVTLYAVWTGNPYTVTLNANDGEGLMADLSLIYGVSGTLSTNTFTRAGYKFSGWNTRADGNGTYYPDSASVSFAPDGSDIVALYAMWTEAERYTIDGTVTNETPAVVSGADVSLQQGGIVIASTKTNPSGRFSLTNILPGLYNLVSTKDSKTVTTLITVVQADVTANITLPNAGTKSSVLVVNNDAGLTVPSIVVGGLDTLAQGVNDKVTMTVTAKAADETNVQQSDIMIAVGSGELAQFLDITLTKGAEDIGGSNNIVLEIVQPFSFSGKTDVKVWRYHGGASEELTRLEAKPSAPFTDATFFADSQNGLIYIYAAKFSTYAVSYQKIIPYSGDAASNLVRCVI